jgi:Rap1a immunity proteins
MRRRGVHLRVGLAAVLPTVAPGTAGAATLAELAGWCAPGSGYGNLCGGYLETILGGLASTNPTMNGGNRTCVPADADRAEIIRSVRAYAARSQAANDTAAIDGVGAALKGRFPCR